ncbi:hypothetical protein [Novosphingobium sp.]|uniref:hypothetical protein n=1 Tax=Novosphingobium sp. TaxID=1874826 RepID=UPI002736B053|nr:hypothetical protein [Novosphingobium sp.]MDP3908117.1 hypothetical protein [Novosphingobium sp.]
MHIRPELAALRSDDAPQRQAQARLIAAVDGWRVTPSGATAGAELARFSGGAPLDDLPLLSALFTAGDHSAQQFTGALVKLLVAELKEDWLGQVPLRHFSDGMLASLVLARCGPAALVVQAIDGAALARKPEPVAVTFAATETWEHVLAGAAAVEQVQVLEVLPDRAVLRRETVQLAPGTVARRFCAGEAQLLRHVPGSMVTLKLQRTLDPSEPTREYRLADGVLLHQAAGSPRESRLELTAALLGRMGRSDAAPLLAAMAQEQGGAGMRWQALRECLGLDTALGFATLRGIAQRAGDPLAAPAGALVAQLLEQYPELAGVERCPV